MHIIWFGSLSQSYKIRDDLLISYPLTFLHFFRGDRVICPIWELGHFVYLVEWLLTQLFEKIASVVQDAIYWWKCRKCNFCKNSPDRGADCYWHETAQGPPNIFSIETLFIDIDHRHELVYTFYFIHVVCITPPSKKASVQEISSDFWVLIFQWRIAVRKVSPHLHFGGD